MKKIAVLVPKGETMSSAVVAPHVIFTKTNELLAGMGQPPAFEVQLVGCERAPSLDGGTFRVKPHCLLPKAGGFGLAIVPGFTGEAAPALAANKPLVAWLKKQRSEHGTELASLCSGAFFIAATGLAEGKKMTTHWAYAEAFKSLFPGVELLSDRIVTDDGGIYASGGAYSSLNLVLYLLEKFCGKAVAVWASKVFQIDLHRTSQKPFVIFNGQKSHVDETVKKVQEYIESNMKNFNYFLFCFFLFSNCLLSQEIYFPPISGDEWETTDPADLGWCSDKIDSLYAFLDATDTKAFLLLKDGKIVLEKYFDGFAPASQWYWASAAKPMMGALAGIAHQDGHLSLDDPTKNYLGDGRHQPVFR